MATAGASPMSRTRGNKVIYVSKKLPEKGRMLKVDELTLGSTDSELHLMQRIYERQGQGKYCLTVRINNQFSCAWLGWIQEEGNELLVKARLNEDYEPKNHLNEKLGLDELDYSAKGQVSIPKKGGA